MKQQFREIILLISGIAIGASVTVIYNDQVESYIAANSTQKNIQTQHMFINPVLECAVTNTGHGVRGFMFGRRMHDLVNDLSRRPNISRVGLYFKDLNNGMTLGINDEEAFRGGSLLKVPLAMGYYKLEEEKRGILDEKIELRNPKLLEVYDMQEEKPEVRMSLNESYTIRNLIERSLVYSDNVAAVMLERYDGNRSLKKLSEEMGISITHKIPPYKELSLREYAGFFRILFNSTYLQPHNSNEILETLSKTKWASGIRSVIPRTILVASKFGESPAAGVNENYLNDCGIVYYPKRPYLLCVSVTGDDNKAQAKVISDISQFVITELGGAIPNP